MFAPNALTVAPATLQRMGSNRWLHWGTTTTFNGRLDFPYHERVLGFQTATLANLLNPFRLARIRDGETKYGAADHGDDSRDDGSADPGDLDRIVGTGGADDLGGAARPPAGLLDQMTQLVVQPGRPHAGRCPLGGADAAQGSQSPARRRGAPGAPRSTPTPGRTWKSRGRGSKRR